MRTPAGTECPHYYEDFFRGRSTQECRLVGRRTGRDAWEPRLCKKCPVPAVLRANGCPNLELEAHVARGLFGLMRRVVVYAFCKDTLTDVENPYVGCGRCHPDAALILESAQVKE
ncbi:MAG: hypothetical protein MUQ10_17305 [Anaerolineae bacterium]|nr:hypothetical protein [Anaerolineae bacterium]